MKAALTLALAIGMAMPALAQSMEFQREVAQKRAVSFSDVVMMFYGLVNNVDSELTPDKAFDDFVKKGYVPESWKEDLQGEASLGQVCYLVCKMLDISGGVMQWTTCDCRRYCYRECARLRLVKAGGPHSRVPGRDLIGMCGRIEDVLTSLKK